MRKALLLILLVLLAYPLCAQHADFNNVDFSRADSLAAYHQGASLKNPEKLTDDLTRGLSTDVEKFRAIFRWITDNISYNYTLLKRNQQKEQEYRRDKDKLKKWKATFSKTVYSSLYTKKSTVCAGYASLLKRMCTHAGLSCETVSGYARTNADRIGTGSVDHAWSVVKLQGKWYPCDATWASGSVDTSTGRFEHRYKPYYFLADPELFAVNHFPEDTLWTLTANDQTLSNFLAAPIALQGYFENKISVYLPAEGVVKVRKNSAVEFCFTSNDTPMLTAISVVYWSARERKNVRVDYPAGKDGGYHTFSQVFSEKGKFDVYIYGDEKALFRYEVIVK